MAQQNINFDKLLTKGFYWGLHLVYTVLLGIFEVAPIISP
jgi:hypothetical protein